MKLKILSALLLGSLAIPAAHAQVSQVAYGSLSGTQLVTFDDVVAGNYDTALYSNGVGFAERFSGQTVTDVAGSDQLGGLPVGALSLAVGAAGRNVEVVSYNGTNVFDGLGSAGFPSPNATGEGAFAALFSSDQSQFGFQLVGGNGGNANISFFRVDGSLIQNLVVSGLANAYYGFSRDGGINDIRGISIWNNDLGGIGFDNLKFDVRSTGGGAVPEPAAWAMMLVGFGVVGGAMRRRRKAKIAFA